MNKTVIPVLFLCSGLLILACSKKPEIRAVTIGTGSITGVYYPTGGAISRMVNSKYQHYKIKASVESTDGSVYNINGVLSGKLELGIAQSDRQFQAVKGLAEWSESGPQTNLRSVFSIHPESVTLVVSEGSGITSVGDLKGKRVNLGNTGSGQLQNAKDALAAFGLDENDIEPFYIKAADSSDLLQRAQIDAFFYTVGHPSMNIKEATSGNIRVRLVPIEGPEVDDLIKKFPYYARSVIPASEYGNAVNRDDIPTFGVRATLVAGKDLDDTIVYAITREVFEEFDDFQSLHPAYQVLTKPDMLMGLSAPLHPGAVKYFKESGLIELVDPRLVQE